MVFLETLRFVIFFCIFETVISLTCNNITAEGQLPHVMIYNVTDYLETGVDGVLNDSKNASKNRDATVFTIGDEFGLLCVHTFPIKWVLDDDHVVRELKQQDVISGRISEDFFNPESYQYYAFYEFQITADLEGPLVAICQSHISPCDRRVIISSQESQGVQFTILEKKGEANNSQLIDFEKALDAVKNPSPLCPATLEYMQVTKKINPDAPEVHFLVSKWIPTDGEVEQLVVYDAMALENIFRLTQPLNDSCLIEGKECERGDKKCKGLPLSIPAISFQSVVTSWAFRGQRVVFKGYFDLTPEKKLHSFQKKLPTQEMMRLYTPAKIYSKQKTVFACDASPIYFAHGSKMFLRLSEHGSSDLIPLTVTEEYQWSEKGTRRAKTSVFQIEAKETKTFVVTCFSPLWDSPGWINQSKSVQIMPTELPTFNETESIFNITTGDEITLHCMAFGDPLPELEFVAPKENLNFTTTLTINETENLISLTAFFPNVDETYNGVYNCVATIPKISDEEFIREFHINVSSPKGTFVRTFLIISAVLFFLFVTTASGILYKMKKDKEEFLKQTIEIIKKFREGFQQSSLGFEAKGEYKKFEVPITHWGMDSLLLGSGAFGVVHRGFVHSNNRKTVVAVKKVNSPKDHQDFENSLIELTIMAYLGRHDHIVSLLATCTENLQQRSLLIGVEYCANGDVLSYIRKRRQTFWGFVRDGSICLESMSRDQGYTNIAEDINTLDLYKWCYHVADGMHFLEGKNVMHGDLAARNVLLTENKVAKISDFGLSRHLQDSATYTKKSRAPLPWRWMAVEALKHQRFSSQSDVWSFGVTAWELFSLGDLPWPEQRWTHEFVDNLEQGLRLKRPSHCSNTMYSQIMLECWRTEPQDRITFTDLRTFFESSIKKLTAVNASNNLDDDELTDL